MSRKISHLFVSPSLPQESEETHQQEERVWSYLRDGWADETLGLGDNDLLPGALDLGEPEDDHEDEAEADAQHLEHPRHWLLPLLLENFKEDDIQETPGGDALDHDEGGHVDVVLLPGVGERHTDANTDGGHGTEHRHVEHGDQRP